MIIKEIGRKENRIARMLSSEPLKNDPRNHCVPVLEVIDNPSNASRFYLVMPLLRSVDDPPFDRVKEIVDFVDQMLEVCPRLIAEFEPHLRMAGACVSARERGSSSVTNNHTTYGSRTYLSPSDCVKANLMMDADAMYPEGFHPVATMRKPDYSGYATYIPRSAAGVKYYYIDFGISVHIPKDASKLVEGRLGRDQTPPELSKRDPYDPFKLDVYILGNMFKRELTGVRIYFCPVTLPSCADCLKKYTNLEFLTSLAEIMTQATPHQRPSAQEALSLWREIKKTIGTIHSEWRPRSVDEDCFQRFARDVVSSYLVFMHFARAMVESILGFISG